VARNWGRVGALVILIGLVVALLAPVFSALG